MQRKFWNYEDHEIILYSEYQELIEKKEKSKFLKESIEKGLQETNFGEILIRIQSELLALDKEEFLLIKNIEILITRKVNQCKEYIMNYRKILQNKIRMMKIVESESLKLRRNIENIEKMEIQKIYDKAQILPNLIETCRSFA